VAEKKKEKKKKFAAGRVDEKRKKCVEKKRREGNGTLRKNRPPRPGGHRDGKGRGFKNLPKKQLLSCSARTFH